MRDRDFTLEVIVNGKPVYEYPHQGDTYIEGRKGSTFRLRFSNRSGKKVLVVPSVDGISTLDGNPAGPDSPGLIAQPNSHIEIPGWMVDTQKAAEFIFKDKESSYARGVDATTTNTGVIGVLVFAEVEHAKSVYPTTTIINNYPPGVRRVSQPWPTSPYTSPVIWTSNTSDSSTYNMVGTSVSASAEYNPLSIMEDYFSAQAAGDKPEQLGVGWGASTDFAVNTTTFDKGEKKSQIVIFYDTRKNLERRGIIVERRDTLSMRPNPFPGYGCKPPADWKG